MNADWKKILVAIGLILTLWWLVSDGERSSRSEELLRAHFHIPDDVEFSQSRYPRRGSANHIEGIVTFTEAQYADYVSKLDDPDIWTAQPFTFGWEEVAPPFAPDALAWVKLPTVYFAGTRNIGFSYLSERLATPAMAGHGFCLALRLPAGQRKASWTRPVRAGDEHIWPVETPARLDAYNGIACNDMGRSERPKYTIHGLLLEDTRTLHMIIQ